MTILWYILYFVILIGVLVFVHEAGHFLMAKLFKVKVHTFSLGFGPRLVGFQGRETEYKIAAVPIGGYVKMLGEDPSEQVDPADRGRAFNEKPVWQRFLIIIGGPVMNLVFPLALHFGVGLTHTEVLPPEVGLVFPGMPAAEAGLQPGDRIIGIDGEPVQTFGEMVGHVAPRPGQPIELTVQRGDERFTRRLAPEPTQVPVLLDVKETIGLVGVGSSYLASVIGVTSPASPAANAGLQTFDRITAVDGKPLDRLVDLERRLVAAAGRNVVLTVTRMKADAKPPFAEPYAPEPIQLELEVPPGIDSLATVGLSSSTDFVAYVDPQGVAAAIGLARGDRLVALDGKRYAMGRIFSAIDKAPDKEHQLSWLRGTQAFEQPFKPKFIPAGKAGKLGVARDAYDKGFWSYAKTSPVDPIENPSLIASAWRYAKAETWNGLRMIGIGMQLLAQGKISLRTLGGPLMIGQLAGMAGQQGAGEFIWMMALISLNLGLINLMPIPVLDGGQLLFIVVEAVIRRPLRRAIKERVMLVGLAMIVALMIFATWNDIERFFVGQDEDPAAIELRDKQ